MGNLGGLFFSIDMAYSYNEVTGTGEPQLIAVPEYIDQSHIIVRVGGVETLDFTWVNDNTVSVTAPVGIAIRVLRRSAPEERVVDYLDGVALTEAVLDADSKQAFFLAQEQLDATDEAVSAIGSLPAALAAIQEETAESFQNLQDAIAAREEAENQKDLATLQAQASAASAATASTHKDAAAASAVASANSASASATSASQAGTQAANAATSATNSANSATASANSATNSANSASAAAGSASTAVTAAAAAAASAGTLNTGGWTTTVNGGGDLEFRYGGTVRMKLTTAGVLHVGGNIIANQGAM